MTGTEKTNAGMKAAIIGGGVIGAGWAARFLLNGWDVAVVDPDPDARRKVAAVVDNARAALPGLYDAALPPEGHLSHHGEIAGAVADAVWVQESVPERLDIKHRVLHTIQSHAPADAVIGSSTSGFKPSDLQIDALRPEQILIAHPFNPVYLLPLVEVVPSAQTAPAIRDEALQLTRSIGMEPILVRKEIDAHIADRFLEAVWREGLWLVKDGVATTEEIDNAIRYGFGLRWAQMGLFETFRIAGGEAGMRHFIAQFGPCLSWPWTKLMDVPELTDDLVEMIASQSDDQAGGRSIRELERIRDENLVGMMRALKRNDWGAGALLNAHEAALRAHRSAAAEADRLEPGAPDAAGATALPVTVRRQVPVSWTDYNGHMNEAHYLEIFGQATDAFMEIIGADADYVARGLSYFTVETHLRHLDEVTAGEMVHIETQVLKGEGKKMHLFHRLMTADGRLTATGEHLLIHVSLETRASCPPEEHIAQRLAAFAKAHGVLGSPEGAGRAIAARA